MKRLLLTLIMLALTIITVDAAAATVCHAEWLPDDTQTKTIEEGDTATFQWYATTNYYGLDATIKLYKGNDVIHVYNPGTLGGSYAGGEQDVTASHYQGPGDYEVLVKCSDTWGFTYQHSIDLTVEEADLDILSVQATANPDSGEAPLATQLTCTAQGGNDPVSYSWILGDGQTASGSQVTHTYAEGTYTATCTAEDADGDSKSDAVTITATEADIPIDSVTVTADPSSGEEPLEVALTCTAQGGNQPLAYSWTLGDGSTATGSQVTHTYSEGSYESTCTVTDVDGDSLSGSATVTVSEADIGFDGIDVTANPGSGEAPLTTDLTCTAQGGNDPVSYSWTLGDGQTASGSQVTHTYQNPGSYTAECTATDADGDVIDGTATITVLEPDVPIDSVTVTADPSSGEDPLTTDLTCTAQGGNQPLSYSWDLDDGTAASGSQVTHTYSEGSYEPTCTVTDVDGDSLSGSDTVTVTEADIGFDDITVTADPDEGDAPLEVDFTCTAQGGNDPVSYSWTLGDGQTASGSSVTHTYQNPGSYTAECTATDADDDVIKGAVTITALQPNRPPVIGDEPDERVPEESYYAKSFDVSDPDDDLLECYAPELPSWLSLDEDDCELYGTAPSVDQDQPYSVTVGVRDPAGLSDEMSYTLTVTDQDNPLVIDEFGCNPDVVQGKRQYCTVKVVDDGGAVVEGALVGMSYDAPAGVEGRAFADCTTNEKGYCSVEPVVEEQPGDYTVEAVASKQGYDDSDPAYDTFKVWEKRYKIKDLEVYDDDGFSNPEDEFYRGDAMYSSFAIYDLFENRYVCDSGLVKDVFLRVYNEEPLPFDEWQELQEVETVKTSCAKCAPCEYRYWLESIPLSDDYLGDGRVFAFAFNFTDGTAGQASKEVTVLNNPVSLDLPYEVVISKYEASDAATETVDLEAHADDLETPDGDLEFAITSVTGLQGLQASIAQGVLTLTAPSGVTGQGTVTVSVDDTDGSTAEDTMKVKVAVEFTPEPPVADAGPDQSALTGETVTFDGTSSYDPDGGDIASYEWTFDNGQTATGATVQTSYNQAGDYTVTLKVTDDEGDTDTDTADVHVTQANRPPVMRPVEDQETPEEEFYSYELQVSDPDDDPLDCYAPQLPSWLSLDEDDCELYGTAPEVEDDQPYDVTVGVRDPEGLVDEQSFTVTVTDQNQAPEMKPVPDQQVEERDSFHYGLLVSDPDLGALTCYAPQLPSWLSLDANTCRLSGTAPEVDADKEYDVTVGVRDPEGLSDEESFTVTVLDENRPPEMGPIPDQEADASEPYGYDLYVSDPDGDELTCYAPELPSWLGLDEDDCTLSGFAPGVDDDTAFDVTVGVRDPEGLSDEESFTLTVLEQPEVVIESAGCNPDVVKGHRQYCSAHVTDDDADDLEDARVEFAYDDGTPLGACTTNGKGYCAVDPVINKEPGVYTARVGATKEGHAPAQPEELQFRVWEKRYEIKGLEVYDDDGFSNPEDEFYRGDAMYSSFAIYDLFENKYVCDDSLVHDVFLRVYDDQPLPFEEWQELQEVSMERPNLIQRAKGLVTGDRPACTYRYWLEAIPLSDDYLGDGRVFAFAFNFTDGTAGQASKEVSVLNNPVSLDLPSEVVISKYEAGDHATETLDLAQYASDRETPDGEYVFAVESIQGIQGLQASVQDGVLELEAPAGVTGEGTITVSVDDTDGSMAEDAMDVRVTVEFTPEPPVAEAGPDKAVDVHDTVTFDGTSSYDPDGGDIVSYEWTFDNGQTATGPTPSTSYDEEGTYLVTLTVTDDEGDTDSDTTHVTVFEKPYVPACSNGKDDDSDGLVDMDDPGCSSPSDPSEYNRGSSGPESGLTVSSISTYGEGGYERAVPGDIVTVEVVLENELDQDLDNLRVTYKVPWLGVKQRSGQFRLDDGDRHTETLQVYLPWGIEPGEYYTEITVSDGDLRRSLHRMLEVVEG